MSDNLYGGQQSAGPRSSTTTRGVKKGLSIAAGTKDRAKKGVSLRQKEREDRLKSLRRSEVGSSAVLANGQSVADAPSAPQHADPVVTDPTNPWSYDHKTLPESVPLDLLPAFVELAMSDEPKELFHGVLMIRKVLSVSVNPPIQYVIDSGVVPRLVEVLGSTDQWPELQFEAAWAVSNVASGEQEHTQMVVDLRAVEHFVRLLQSPSEEIREQACWAVGNIAGDSITCRDDLIDLGALPGLLWAIDQPVSKVSVLRNAVWSMSNLLRGTPPPKLEVIRAALGTIVGLLNHHDKDVVADACWAMSYVTDGTPAYAQAAIQSGALPRVVQLLVGTVSCQVPALRIVGNVTSGSDAQTREAVEAGILGPFHFLLAHTRRAIMKEALWSLSNILAAPEDLFQAVIDAELVPKVIQKLLVPELDIKKEAVYCIANATVHGNNLQKKYLWDIGAIPALLSCFATGDYVMLPLLIKTLETLLETGADLQRHDELEANPVAVLVEENNGVDTLFTTMDTVSYSDVELYDQLADLMNKYFSEGGVPMDYNDAAGGAAEDPNAPYNFNAFNEDVD